MAFYTFLTADDIISAAKAEAIGSTTSSLTALQDTQMLAKVQQINSEFVNAAHTRHPIGGWTWMRAAPYYFQSVDSSEIRTSASAAAATLAVTFNGTGSYSAAFTTRGKIVVENDNGLLDFVDIASISSAGGSNYTYTVETASDGYPVGYAHAAGDYIEWLYELPTSFSKPAELIVGETPYKYQRFDSSYPDAGYYTFVGSHLFLPRAIGQKDCTMHYFKKGATISALTTSTNIPVEFSRYAIEKLKAHIYMIRRKRADIQLSMQLAEDCLQYAFSMDCQIPANSEASRIPLPY